MVQTGHYDDRPAEDIYFCCKFIYSKEKKNLGDFYSIPNFSVLKNINSLDSKDLSIIEESQMFSTKVSSNFKRSRLVSEFSNSSEIIDDNNFVNELL